MHESEESFVLLGCPQKFKCDSTRADGSDHRRDFERCLAILQRDLQIKYVVHMDGGLAFDDATAHRDIQNRSLSSYFSP